jgi:bacillithiol system protein YtxJ
MKWIEIENMSQVDQLFESSLSTKQLIFKHSTRCSISSMALRRAEEQLPIPNLTSHYLDLIQFRNVSDYISEKSGVVHQSPQVIVINNNNVVYHGSHGSIDWQEIKKLCIE